MKEQPLHTEARAFLDEGFIEDPPTLSGRTKINIQIETAGCELCLHTELCLLHTDDNGWTSE